MKTTNTETANVVQLNPQRVTESSLTPDSRQNSGSSLDLINTGELAEADLAALGLSSANDDGGPAFRPDPVDIISIGGRQLDVDSIRKEEYRAPVTRGGELDLVA